MVLSHSNITYGEHILGSQVVGSNLSRRIILVAQTAQIQASSDGKVMDSDTIYTQRARYFDSENAFNIVHSPVPGHSFVAERDRAFSQNTGTRFIPLDQSDTMNLSYPATTPLILASYARISAGDVLTHTPCASAVFGFVIKGQGCSLQGEEKIEWGEGDVFCFSGGVPISHSSAAEDSILWVVTNEPQLAFEGFLPPDLSSAPVQATHFPAAEIERELKVADAKIKDHLAAGLAVVISTKKLEESKNISPSLTLAMNQLRAGGVQPPHRHNSVAVSLIVDGSDGYSMVDGIRKNWEPWVTIVTPPESVHSHHNDSSSQASWLIVQDGGLYYHCRTMGFSYS